MNPVKKTGSGAAAAAVEKKPARIARVEFENRVIYRGMVLDAVNYGDAGTYNITAVFDEDDRFIRLGNFPKMFDDKGKELPQCTVLVAISNCRYITLEE